MSERVGSVIFRGDIEIGFQQYSELLPIKGIKIIGMLPKEIRKSFIFGSAMFNNSPYEPIYRNLIKFIKHDDIQKFITKSGLKIL